MELRCFKKILQILYKHKVANEDICNKIKPVIEPYKDLTMVNKCRLNGTATFHIHLALQRLSGQIQREEAQGDVDRRRARQH